MAKKKAPAQTSSDTLGDIAAGLGSLLGNAEKQWRAWQGPREAVVKAVSDVRDRAAALLSEMGAAAEAAAGKGSKKGKKKDKKAKKAGKKADKKAAKAEQAAASPKAEKAGKGDKGKKAGKKKKDKAGKKAGKAQAAAPDDAGA